MFSIKFRPLCRNRNQGATFAGKPDLPDKALNLRNVFSFVLIAIDTAITDSKQPRF